MAGMSSYSSTEQARFEAVFYGSESPLVIFKGPDLVYEMLNDTYQSIYPGRSLLGKPLLEAVPELKNSAFPNILKKVYETGDHFVSHEGVVYLHNALTGETEERYFDTTFSRIDYGDGHLFRILANPKEVTEKVMARKKMEQSLRELEAEKDLRERFVSALSHDLRTPLAVVKLSAQMLQMKNSDPAIFAKCITRIMNNVDRSDRMIRDLLDANRLKANEGLPVTIEPCKLEDIVSHAITDLEDLHGKRFVVQNPTGTISGFWDKTAVHRIIENLASNAIKYGSENSSVTIGLKQLSDMIEISVHNFGNAISSEDQKRLFQPYQRTEFAKASKQKGWGIGLSLVQGLARAHNGSVTLESFAECGTTFTVQLPVDARK